MLLRMGHEAAHGGRKLSSDDVISEVLRACPCVSDNLYPYGLCRFKGRHTALIQNASASVCCLHNKEFACTQETS